MNRYSVLSIGFLLVSMILLFSGFAYISVYHWLVFLWLIFFSSLLAMKSEFTKRPDLASKKKYYYAFLIFAFIVISVVIPVLASNPPKNSPLIAKLIITGLNSLVTLLFVAKLFFHWHKVNTAFKVTSFIAIFVLISSILFFWVFI